MAESAETDFRSSDPTPSRGGGSAPRGKPTAFVAGWRGTRQDDLGKFRETSESPGLRFMNSSREQADKEFKDQWKVDSDGGTRRRNRFSADEGHRLCGREARPQWPAATGRNEGQ
jgi:hypothetical protein